MKTSDNSQPRFQIVGLDHVVLRVADLQRSTEFYCDVLGCSLERTLEDLGLVQLRAGNSLIDLVDVNAPLGKQGGEPPLDDGHNMDHFCIRITSLDPKVLAEHLKKHGVQTGDVGRRYGADGYGPSMYIKDPDGYTVELKGPPDDVQ